MLKIQFNVQSEPAPNHDEDDEPDILLIKDEYVIDIEDRADPTETDGNHVIDIIDITPDESDDRSNQLIVVDPTIGSSTVNESTNECELLEPITDQTNENVEEIAYEEEHEDDMITIVNDLDYLVSVRL